MSFYRKRKILVTGGTGLIGTPLVEMLLNEGGDVTVVSLDDPSRAPRGARFVRADLRRFSVCMDVCRGREVVFNLVGVKGSPAMAAEKPASFFVPMLQFNTNMMEAARCAGVDRYLYTSSIGVYAPAECFHEDVVWETFPSSNDRFAGWAKRMGELQAEAYAIEYGWDRISIVRPANVYGPYDNFDPRNAMVIPSLITRVLGGERPLTVWGDGSPVRDFIFARDVAVGMMLAVEKGVSVPVNLGSGLGVSIRELAETVAACAPNGPVEIKWDTTKPAGDAVRLMDTGRAKRLLDFEPKTSLRDGIRETMEWFSSNESAAQSRYNVFARGSR
ncbi:MAG: NAD-dependent epimerase/dehydratase family protein [Syntrophobacteraceae bacterium]